MHILLEMLVIAQLSLIHCPITNAETFFFKLYEHSQSKLRVSINSVLRLVSVSVEGGLCLGLSINVRIWFRTGVSVGFRIKID